MKKKKKLQVATIIRTVRTIGIVLFKPGDTVFGRVDKNRCFVIDPRCLTKLNNLTLSPAYYRLESKKAAKTYSFVRDIAVSQLQNPSDDDANDWWEAVDNALGGTGPGFVDSSSTTAERLMKDPKVVKAFKEFCKGVAAAADFVETFNYEKV